MLNHDLISAVCATCRDYARSVGGPLCTAAKARRTDYVKVPSCLSACENDGWSCNCSENWGLCTQRVQLYFRAVKEGEGFICWGSTDKWKTAVSGSASLSLIRSIYRRKDFFPQLKHHTTLGHPIIIRKPVFIRASQGAREESLRELQNPAPGDESENVIP